jgi:hypothetical protein
MNPTLLSNLKSLLYSDASLQNKTDSEVAAILNEPTVTLTSVLYTDKMLIRDLDLTVAITLLETISSIAASNGEQSPLFKRIKLWLEGSGIDLGLPKTRAMIDQFVQLNLITQEQGNQIKSLAQRVSYRLGEQVTANDVEIARKVNAAETLHANLENQLHQKVGTAMSRLNAYLSSVSNGDSPTEPTLSSLLE